MKRYMIYSNLNLNAQIHRWHLRALSRVGFWRNPYRFMKNIWKYTVTERIKCKAFSMDILISHFDCNIAHEKSSHFFNLMG